MKKLSGTAAVLLLMTILGLTLSIPAFAASPNAAVNIEAIPGTIPVGGTSFLVITEKNTGDVALTDVYVYLYANDVAQPTCRIGSEGWVGGDINHNGVLDVHEIWTWVIRVNPLVDTQFNVYGDARYGDVGLYDPIIYPSQKDITTVKVVKCNWWWLFLNWLYCR